MTTAERTEFNELMTKDIADLRKHACPFCGQQTEYDSHITKKELCELIVTGGIGTCYDDDYHACPECAKRIRECVAGGHERYAVRSSESGDVIEEMCDLAEAERTLNGFVATDKADGTFTQGFYEIWDNYTETTVKRG